MTFTAEISISPKVALGDKCAVTVVNDDDIRDGMESTDTPLSIDGDHTREQVTDAAETVLATSGWKVIGDWEDGDNSYYVTVERADQMPTFITQIATAEELREAAKGPDRCPRHHGTAANPDALPCEEGAVYVVSGPANPERKDQFDCSHQAANYAELFGDTDLLGEENRLTVTKMDAS